MEQGTQTREQSGDTASFDCGLTGPFFISEYEQCLALFEPYIPENAELVIEQTDGKLCTKYLIRMFYTSPKSGRKLGFLAKTDVLPTEHNEHFINCMRQIVLSPQEVAKEFSIMYFREKRAKQEAFLFSNTNTRVSGKTKKEGDSDGAVAEDRLRFNDYQGATPKDDQRYT